MRVQPSSCLGCLYRISQEELRKHTSSFLARPSRFAGKDPLTDPDVEAAVPVKEGSKARFFVLRSLNHDNLAVSAVV